MARPPELVQQPSPAEPDGWPDLTGWAELAGWAELPEHQRELFQLRLHRWWPDLREGLLAAYGPAATGPLADRLIRVAATAFAAREPDLARLDAVRTLAPDWFQSPAMLGYAAYTDRFATDLAGLADRIDYLRELGVSYLHLMPLLRPRPGDSDGGYAVADYRSVRPDLGTMTDLRELAGRLRAGGISLVLDLVLNHVAREHPWAQAARDGEEYYRAFFHTFADRELPDSYERTLPEVFPDFAPGNFSWDEELGAWVWTTFNSFQWDLNWSNPEVLVGYAEIILFLANAGVEVLRLDAIAFLWKRMGTDCQNQPEVHALTQALRALARIAAPALSFKAEAIVGPGELVNYLGRGARYGKVSELAYHNSLMVQIWSMLAAQDVRLAARALRRLPPVPASTAWITYLRCHDDIGWAIDDADAAAVGLDGYSHRAFLSDFYSGRFPGSPANGLVFQANPATGDRRISGMAASLAGLEQAGTDPAQQRLVVDRLLLAYALVLGWGGIPVIWMGDELALTNDPHWAEEDGHGEDNRWAHRPRMDWAMADRRHDPESVPGRMFTGLRTLAARRAVLAHLHASVAAEVLEPADPGVLPVLRRHPLGPMLGLYNVTGSWRPFPVHRLAALGLDQGTDAISGRLVRGGLSARGLSGDGLAGGGLSGGGLAGAASAGAASVGSDKFDIGPDGSLWLAPYAALWIIS